METNYMVIISTVVNVLLIIGISIAVVKGIKKIKNFVNKFEKLDKKMDDVLKKL
ncbi:hypothetical protein [uncultured Clostridium sp.]|uniref:hypothetical protein n=1 Tax=uncultured Clostridium sp. TaxID=59620 RepID=UPI0028EAFA6F|nr:hypothetical protein [uncultured Clostridium sp.]